MTNDKVYLKPGMHLSVGDFLMERSRFKPNDYVIMRITRIERHLDSMYVVRVFGTDRIYNANHEIYCQISAHTTQKNTAWLTYKLHRNHPYVVLYGKED